ncbi:MAG: DNA segregation ATPase FtsK/SpoIIIE, S-DNA-T family [Candidatus Peregrinibacteria bacterium Greene0416_19]|nr:MAG: DNA segregation ATPase FtsK/SpoIIIE, S-DNA-T family [Candidatus Peregrinibacteria bacterium Greene0416_19]
MPKPRKRARRSPRTQKELKSTTRSAIGGILQICAGVVLFLVLRQNAGPAGDSLRGILTFFFGAYGMMFPLFLVLSGILHWIAPERKIEVKRSTGLALCFLAFLGLMHIQAPLEEIGARRDDLAGIIGFTISLPFLVYFSQAVGMTIFATTFLIGVFIAFEPDVGGVFRWFTLSKKSRRERLKPIPVAAPPVVEEEETEEDDEDLLEEGEPETELNIVRPAFAQTIAKNTSEKILKTKMKKKDAIEMTDTRYEEWTFPTFDLLDDTHSHLQIDDEELKTQAKLIEDKLKEFEIDVTVRDARPGPTVTQFTLQPAEGVKLARISALKDDLALALAAPSLRIEAPIPGKSLVGIEMPNRNRTIVHMREILESPTFVQNKSSLTLPLGRDVSGESVIAALEDMPHLLIAGATGSGKSVCMNTFLSALLFQNAPHELKFILIDPKRVELIPYDGIPHLLTPVIAEAERALQALRWAVAEMGRRLHRFSEQGARNLEEFNEKQTDESAMLPRIVIVIDELADLMMRQFRRDTEMMVARIAQMARATGMHLIIATQRPSVDVITGLIKANIPTRIAFRVVSSVDSRTILDGIGAEDLLGMGDMLYMNASTPKPVRVQGIFTSTKEVERVINAVKIAGGGKITEQIAINEEDEDENDDTEAALPGEHIDGTGQVTSPYAAQHIDLEADDNGGDDLFFDAVRVVQMSGKASASLLQRQLRVGYARAARLLDIMEEKGLIGPVDGAKARKVYTSP